MMAEALGGAFLSGFVNVVLERLFSREVLNLIQGKKLHQELVQRLKTTLYAVQAVLNDAERKQINDMAVKMWLNDLSDAFYVADDLLDKISTEAATHKEVSNFFSGFLNLRDRKVVNEIEDIASRLEYIVKHKDFLGLKEIPCEDFSWRIPSTSLLEGSESDIYGRDKDKESIKKLLLDDNSEENVSVIPIWGMGGVGKTTLAQWLYNDENLMANFDLKAWVCVSEESNIVKITNSVIGAVASSAYDVKDLNLLQLGLKEKLSGKKFFLVLDDVWNIGRDGWNSFRKPFQCVIKGSKILVTTRSETVASRLQTAPSYLLHELSNEYCWSLFAKHACFPESGGDSNLEKIGKDIVKRCQGLPLAAETLGSLLQTKHDIKNWKAILTSEIWEFSIDDSKIIPALKISYYHLPPHLKRCFAYSSLFPKDYTFDKDELILLWMAEDLLPSPKKGETLEEVGSECFDDLTSRSFFKKKLRIGVKSFEMHDLIHDLAISVAGDFYFRTEELGKAENIKIQTRHLSYERLSHPVKNNFDTIDKLKSLRTFLPINFSIPSFGFENAALTILTKLVTLRVLSFCNFKELDVLPDSIGELIQLRYLDFSRTGIKTLPESLSKLYNLQTLKLYYCRNLTMLPTGMQNLVNLRHLDIRKTHLKEMPPGMSKLKHLQVLSYFVVGEHEENGIKELGELSNIHESLWLRNLENVTNSGEAEEARIKDKTHISSLALEWSSDNDRVTTSHLEAEIFDKLQPHKGLKKLKIMRYKGTRFSDWIGHSSYHKMTDVILESCSNCYILPSLGELPYLKSLKIANFDTVESIGDEFYKNNKDASLETPFPSLEKLTFRSMSCWEVWHSSESYAFPQLKDLRIIDCPNLRGDLPHHLPVLKRLEIRNCPKLTDLPIQLPSLEILEINECEQLVSSLRISNSSGLGLQEFPISLQSLFIEGCQLVESMVRVITNIKPTCLQSLTISDCSCALSFSGDCLPECLKELRIFNCRNLKFPKQHNLLKLLHIHDSCHFLTSFSLEAFPNLKSLEIIACLSLQSLSMSSLHSKVCALKNLTISRCPNFVWFRAQGLTAPNLTYFCLNECPMLMSLPSNMNTLLPKLQLLSIRDCPQISVFPQGGLPPNLDAFSILKCENLLMCLSLMGVHESLICLSIVDASSESVNSFPKEGVLPQLPSLSTLELCAFETMETLDCNGILHLTSLQVLRISSCPKLNNMVGERLPSSLLKLEISDTPLLEQQCNKKHPQIWHKISHIPGIRVKGRWVS